MFSSRHKVYFFIRHMLCHIDPIQTSSFSRLYLEKNIERYCTERACICITFSTGSCCVAWKLAGWHLDMIFHSKIRTMCFAYVPCSRIRNAGSVHDKVLLGKLPTAFKNLQFCLVFLIDCHMFGNVFITHGYVNYIQSASPIFIVRAEFCVVLTHKACTWRIL